MSDDRVDGAQAGEVLHPEEDPFEGDIRRIGNRTESSLFYLRKYLEDDSNRPRYLALNRLRHHLEDALRECEGLQVPPH